MLISYTEDGYTLRKYPFLEMGWRGKRDFTVLNNGILRKGNDLVKTEGM